MNCSVSNLLMDSENVAFAVSLPSLLSPVFCPKPPNYVQNSHGRYVGVCYMIIKVLMLQIRTPLAVVDWVWNVMAHAQKPDLVFQRNGRVHLNQRGCQFSRILAAEVCASAVVMLDTPCSEVVWRVMATHYIRQFPHHFPSLASPCVPSYFNWLLAGAGLCSWTVSVLNIASFCLLYLCERLYLIIDLTFYGWGCGMWRRYHSTRLYVHVNGKAISLQAWTGPESSSRLRLPDFKTVHEGGKVSPTHQPPLPPRKYSWYSFLLETESTPGP